MLPRTCVPLISLREFICWYQPLFECEVAGDLQAHSLHYDPESGSFFQFAGPHEGVHDWDILEVNYGDISDHIETEARHTWDSVIPLYLGDRQVVRPEKLLLYHLHNCVAKLGSNIYGFQETSALLTYQDIQAIWCHWLPTAVVGEVNANPDLQAVALLGQLIRQFTASVTKHYGAIVDAGATMLGIGGRALSDFTFGTNDGLILVEILGVFDDTDEEKLADVLKDYSLLGIGADKDRGETLEEGLGYTGHTAPSQGQETLFRWLMYFSGFLNFDYLPFVSPEEDMETSRSSGSADVPVINPSLSAAYPAFTLAGDEQLSTLSGSNLENKILPTVNPEIRQANRRSEYVTQTCLSLRATRKTKLARSRLPSFVHHIIDTNRPEWDLSDSSSAVDLSMFLILLCTRRVPEVVNAFKSNRQAFVEDGRAGRHEHFSWKVAHQKKTNAYKEMQKKRAAEEAD
ncbi:hypothetical protein BD413DRAFT_491053 [Trametes elegans]|nr:hypothetical protein BD413DRAFT_491053 [Trametes elegans]